MYPYLTDTAELEGMPMFMHEALIPAALDSSNYFALGLPSHHSPVHGQLADLRLSPFIHASSTSQNMMAPGYPYQAGDRELTNPDRYHCCLIRKMATITRQRLREKYNPTLWIQNPTPEALRRLEDSYLTKAQETADAYPLEAGFSWPGPESLTEEFSKPHLKVIILHNALRDITLFQEFAHSILYKTDRDKWPSLEVNSCNLECSKGLGINSRNNSIHACEDTSLLQEESYHELDNHTSTIHSPLHQLRVDSSPESNPLLENMAIGSQLQNFTPAFASGRQLTPDHNVSDGYTTPHAESNSDPVASSHPQFTAINSKGPHNHRRATKGVPCPIKSCSRNSHSPPKYFARADNLGGHLRKVHGIHIPSRARVRHWITGNKNTVLLQAAEEETRRLHELGILGEGGTWECPGV